MLPRSKSKCFLLHMRKLMWPRMVRGRAKTRLGLLLIIPVIFWPFHTVCFYYLLFILWKNIKHQCFFLLCFPLSSQIMVMVLVLSHVCWVFPVVYNTGSYMARTSLTGNEIMDNLCSVNVCSQEMMTTSRCTSPAASYRPSFYRDHPSPNPEPLRHLVCNNNTSPKMGYSWYTALKVPLTSFLIDFAYLHKRLHY